MKRSKLIFIILSILFLIILILVMIDFSRKTTFPGSKQNKKDQSGLLIEYD